MIDLHIHSTISGGNYQSDDIIKIVKRRKCKAISITEHNYCCEQNVLKELCEKEGIIYIYGCEHTAFYKGHEVHILAYYSSPPDEKHISMINKRRVTCEIVKRRKNRRKEFLYTDLFDLIDNIHRYEGIAILAHPQYYKELEEIFPYFDGFELLHPDNSLKIIDYLCEKYDNYLFSCGTDMYMDEQEYNSLWRLQEIYKEKFAALFKKLSIKIEL